MSALALDQFVHRFVPGSDPAAPTLLLLHGTGGNEDDLIPLARMIEPAASLLSPRGQVLERGMPRFFRRIAEGVFDVEDLKRRTHELADFIAAATARYGFDPARLVALGYSNGANIAASLLLLEPRALAGAIVMRAMVPFEPEGGGTASLAGVPVLIGAGRLDPIARAEQSERLAGILRRRGADVTLRWERAGHGLEAAEIEAAREWLKAKADGLHRPPAPPFNEPSASPEAYGSSTESP
jgi:predicted esterase